MKKINTEEELLELKENNRILEKNNRIKEEEVRIMEEKIHIKQIENILNEMKIKNKKAEDRIKKYKESL